MSAAVDFHPKLFYAQLLWVPLAATWSSLLHYYSLSPAQHSIRLTSLCKLNLSERTIKQLEIQTTLETLIRSHATLSKIHRKLIDVELVGTSYSHPVSQSVIRSHYHTKCALSLVPFRHHQHPSNRQSSSHSPPVYRHQLPESVRYAA